MTTAELERPTRHEAGCPDCTDGLGRASAVEEGSLRHRIRSKPGLSQAWRVAVFTAGLILVAFGLALAVLPGPLTIPPVLAGLWVWSTEFDWAKRFFETFKEKAKATLAHAKQHPVGSSLITVGGLVAAAVVVWLVGRYELVERIKDMVGL